MPLKNRKRPRIDNAIRKVLTDAEADIGFEEGSDVLLRLGCYLFLEKVARESRDVALMEDKKQINGLVLRKAVKSVLSDVRQF